MDHFHEIPSRLNFEKPLAGGEKWDCAVTEGESCAQMFNVATEEQRDLKVTRSNSHIHDRCLNELAHDLFSVSGDGFTCFAYYHLIPLVGNTMYIEYKRWAMYVADVTNIEPLQEVKFPASIRSDSKSRVFMVNPLRPVHYGFALIMKWIIYKKKKKKDVNYFVLRFANEAGTFCCVQYFVQAMCCIS